MSVDEGVSLAQSLLDNLEDGIGLHGAAVALFLHGRTKYTRQVKHIVKVAFGFPKVAGVIVSRGIDLPIYLGDITCQQVRDINLLPSWFRLEISKAPSRDNELLRPFYAPQHGLHIYQNR